MENKYQKRYFILIIIIVLVGILFWRVSTSYAYMNQGYEGNNIVSGDKWGVNIVEISDVETIGNAEVIGDVSSIATTLSFNALLKNPGDKISFNVTVQNTSNLNAELYALTLSGLNDVDGELINYSILPIDSSYLHDNETSGSIIKKGEKQVFQITLEYNNSSRTNKEYHLSLGSTIIYKQK